MPANLSTPSRSRSGAKVTFISSVIAAYKNRAERRNYKADTVDAVIDDRSNFTPLLYDFQDEDVMKEPKVNVLV